jgi:hypothetical protein
MGLAGFVPTRIGWELENSSYINEELHKINTSPDLIILGKKNQRGWLDVGV